MALHKDLTGADLHEPKGIAGQTSGKVYISNGANSGAWTDKNADILNANNYTLEGDLTDIGTAASSVFFFVHKKSTISRVAAVPYAAMTGANSILSIYINGVLFADTLTVPFSGSAAGTPTVGSIVTPNTVNANSVIEVRTDGGATNAVRATVSLLMLNTA